MFMRGLATSVSRRLSVLDTRELTVGATLSPNSLGAPSPKQKLTIYYLSTLGSHPVTSSSITVDRRSFPETLPASCSDMIDDDELLGQLYVTKS
ncbi:unnamed protein product [Caenorhabditis auriculariae]|uniref:Uncharacterized protein n=1 Tax=Caenorhabditis auriculariae TaxID=2777116 RepID=A0A8S1H6P6_9PELO|nr:unnamed protein product [Caenorhabditis auriculariae]